MTQTLNSKPIPDPELVDALQVFRDDIFYNMNCVKIGIVQSFDGTKKTAEVQCAFKRVLKDGTIVRHALLIDCPVFTLQGGGAFVEMPIAPGDNCLLLFSDRNLDAWFETGSEAPPYDARAHHFTDAIALVGLNSLQSSLPNYVPATARFGYGGAEVDISANLITLKNQTTTLLVLLDGLIDVIAAITVQDGMSTLPLTAAAIAALEAYKLQLALLLY
jgi:hypothetical protein